MAKNSKAQNMRRSWNNAIQFGKDYPLRPEDREPTVAPTEPHRYSVQCHIRLQCKLCQQKWLEEHIDTLPDAARAASLENMK